MVAFNRDSLCREAESHYFNLLMEVEQGNIPQHIADHIRQCRHCSSRVEELRSILASKPSNLAANRPNAAANTILKLHFAYLGHPVKCETVKPFLPTLLDPALEIRIPTPITVHLDHCQSCSDDLEKIRGLNLSCVELLKLSQTLADKTKDKCINTPNARAAASEIMDRPESGVATVYNMIESQNAKASDVNNSENLYSGFPICVEVSKKEPIVEPAFAAAGARRVSARRFAPLVKFGGIAAAVAITALIFMYTTPAAKAVKLEQIQAAVQKVKNVHITKFTPGTTEPAYSQWVSRSLEVYMANSRGEQAVWDLGRGIRKITNIQTGEIRRDSLTSEDVTRMETLINGSLGMMPFENMSSHVKDSQWNRLDDASLPGETSVMEVYDLLWVDKNSSLNNKWRFFVDPKTRLPRRTEFYQMLPGEQDYIFMSFSIINYPTDDEIRTMLDKSSSESKSFRTP